MLVGNRDGLGPRDPRSRRADRFAAFASLFLSYASALAGIQFVGPELFPLDPRIENLIAADLNGDGSLDLLINNPRRSKLQLLYNQTSTAPTTKELPAIRGINELPPDSRFRVESVSTEERVSSVRVVDFFGDEQVEIVYCGNLDEVVLLERRDGQGWVERESWRIPGIVTGRDALQVGDFDGDGRSEILVLAEGDFHLIRPPQGSSQERTSLVQRIPHVNGVKALKVFDLNADGRDDLLSVVSGNSGHMLVRFGNENGIGNSDAVIEFGVNRFLGMVDPSSGVMVSVSARSGRASVGRLRSVPAPVVKDSIGDGLAQRIALPKRPIAGHTLAWADLDGNQRTDLVFVDPKSGRLFVSLQDSEAGFSVPQSFGTYQDVGQLVVADWNQDGVSEIFLLSYAEGQVGVTQWKSSGVKFPVPIELKGKPLGIAVGSFRMERPERLVVLERTAAGLEICTVGSDLDVVRELVDFSIDASRVEIHFHDANQDGVQDLVLLAPYEPLLVLLRNAENGGFEAVEIASALSDLDDPWIGKVDVDADGKRELIIPQRNAVRALVLEPRDEGERDWFARVKLQLNGDEAGSVLGGVVSLSQTAEGEAQVCMLDTETGRLNIQVSEPGGRWKAIANLDLPPGDYLGMSGSMVRLGDENGIALVGNDSVFVKSLGGEQWSFEIEGGYETDLTGASLGYCLGGDFDQDQLVDFVFLETAKHHVELVTRRSDGSLKLDYRWPIFESRTFRSRRSELPEPREAWLDDFTGDGRLDLVLLVHDRIVLYPQE